MSKISELSNGGALLATDDLIVVRSGGNVRAQLSAISGQSVSATTLAASGATTLSSTLAVSGALTVDTNTLVVDVTNNRVGIGTSNPDTTLHLQTPSGTKSEINFAQTALTNYRIGVPASTDALVFTYGASTERMRIDALGNVGIGVSNPSDYYATELVVAGPSEGGITIASTGNHTNYINFADSTSGVARYAGMIEYAHAIDAMSFRTNSIQRMRITSAGAVELTGPGGAGETFLNFTADSNTLKAQISGAKAGSNGGTLRFSTNNSSGTLTEAFRVDQSSNLLVGATTGSTHIIKKSVSVGNIVLEVAGNNLGARFFNADGGSPSAANTAVTVYSVGATGRSINAAGTVNANGADYAEYEQNNGLTISKGSVVGFKTDGTMTLTFNEAIRFAVKSTNPSFVGGDTWGTEDQVGASIEAARQLVDRIAYSGKVPVNIQGAAAGDYIIAVAADDGSIDGQAVADPDFTQYKLAVGRVNRILDDGRAEIAVIIH